MPLHKDHCYVIAEVGSNHMGHQRYCEDAIREAAHAGADAVKFQLFTLGDILRDPKKAPPFAEKWCLPAAWLPLLRNTCREYHVDFLCTPFAAWAVAELNPYVDMWKIGSFEYKRQDIWDAVKATHKTIIASDGRGTPPVGALRLYCVSKYPASPEDIHIPSFGVHHGFSDHTTSTVIPALAVARGARIIEKHFRLAEGDESSPDWDHSLTPDEFAEMVSNIRLAELTCWRQPPQEDPRDDYPNRRE